MVWCRNAGWGIKISHFSKRYKVWKKPPRKKIEYMSEKYIKNSFLMGFKNQIRRLAATHCWRRSRKFFITLRVSSGGMEPISCWIPSFKSSRDRGRCLKTFSFRYPQRKTSHGLKSGDRAGHSTSPLKSGDRAGHSTSPIREIKRPGNDNKAPMFTGPNHYGYWQL